MATSDVIDYSPNSPHYPETKVILTNHLLSDVPYISIRVINRIGSRATVPYSYWLPYIYNDVTIFNKCNIVVLKVGCMHAVVLSDISLM